MNITISDEDVKVVRQTTLIVKEEQTVLRTMRKEYLQTVDDAARAILREKARLLEFQSKKATTAFKAVREKIIENVISQILASL